jgi:para-aminobenzoate synthetase component I
LQRSIATFGITDIDTFKQQMLAWVNQFSICCFLNNHHYKQAFEGYECLVGIGAQKVFAPTDNTIEQLREFCNGHNDWLFGNLSYGLKNEIEGWVPSTTSNTQFPNVFLFQPSVVIELAGGEATISSLTLSPTEVFNQICQSKPPERTGIGNITITPRIEKAAYIEAVEKIKAHIQKGDCYVLNFCQEFYAEEVDMNPVGVYSALAQVSPTPFGCFYKVEDNYLLCASPERYLKKIGDTIISQPIKGTAKRSHDNAIDDSGIKQHLQANEKERSENVMVVDLVRNDLSRICMEGSVTVPELFGLYTFPQVHQLISTIKGQLMPGVSFADIVQATFPMGSMTGAPKRRVMELIEQYETTPRGLFSGAVGYIKPDGDFDFNVVIRSIFYNTLTQYLNYLVGGGITFYSDPNREYEECLLKAEAIEQVLMQKSPALLQGL